MNNRPPSLKRLAHDSDLALIQNVSAILDTVIECPNCLSKLRGRISKVDNTPAEIHDEFNADKV